MSDLEHELGLALPKLGTLEFEGIPVEGGDSVVQLTAHLPNNGGDATMHMSLESAKQAGEALLQIVATLEEMR